MWNLRKIGVRLDSYGMMFLGVMKNGNASRLQRLA